MRRHVKLLAVGTAMGATCAWIMERRRGDRRSSPLDVTNSALIVAAPDVVFRAIVDEFDGLTSWWSPYHSMQARRGASFAEPGAVVDNIVRAHGKFPIEFATQTVDVEENARIGLDYIEGSGDLGVRRG